MQLILVSPILPGRTGACRRFVQEMTDDRGEEYAASRAAMGVHQGRIWIHETATPATVIVLMETDSPESTLHTLATSQLPFDCWYRQEILAFSGCDLADEGYKLTPELISGWL